MAARESAFVRLVATYASLRNLSLSIYTVYDGAHFTQIERRFWSLIRCELPASESEGGFVGPFSTRKGVPANQRCVCLATIGRATVWLWGKLFSRESCGPSLPIRNQ